MAENSRHSGTKVHWGAVLGIVLFALALRSICLVRAPLIGADTYRFMLQAERFENRDFENAAGDPYHPLTSYLIAVANRAAGAVFGAPEQTRDAQGRREWAAHGVLFLAGIALVLLSMDLSRRHFPQVPPEMVGLLAAAQPYFVRSSADIMSDTLFLALFLLALREGSRTVEERGWLTPIACGGAVGLAYLARPEGLILIPTLLVYWFLEHPRRVAPLLARLSLFGVGAALLVFPYVCALYLLFGRWTLTAKKSIDSLLGIAASAQAQGAPMLADPAPLADSWVPLDAALHLLFLWFTTTPEALAIPAIIGFAWIVYHKEWKRGHTLYALVAVVLVAILVRLAMSVQDSDYLSRRHVFLLVAVSLPFAARGIQAMVPLVLEPIVRRRLATKGLVFLVLVALSIMIPKSVFSQRTDQLAQRHAGEWILETRGIGEHIFTAKEKVPYYAQGWWRAPGFEASPEAVVAAVKSEPRAWLVFYRETVDQDCPGLRALLESREAGLVLMESFPEKRSRHTDTLDVYFWERSQ